MLKTFTTSYKKLANCGRFEVRYFYLDKKIEDLASNLKCDNLVNLAKFIKKGVFDLQAERYQKSGVPFIRVSDIKHLTIDLTNIVYISEEDNKKEIKTCLYPKDIVFSKIGTIGKIAQIPSYISRANASQNVIAVALKENVDKDYILGVLISKFVLWQLQRNLKQQMQDKLTLPDVRNLLIPSLPSSTIKEISSAISTAKEKDALSVAKIRLAQERFLKYLNVDLTRVKKEMFYKIKYSGFKKNVLWTPAYYYPLYVSSLETIKKCCSTASLESLNVDIQKGNEVGSENYRKYLKKNDSDIPFIRTSDMVNYGIDNYPDFYISEDIFNELKQDIQADDVLFTNDGKIGLTAMLTETDKCIIQSHIRRLRVKSKELDNYYLFLALSVKEIGLCQANMYTVVQSTIPTIANNLKNFIIPLLSQKQRNEISQIVREAFVFKKESKLLIQKAKDVLEDKLGAK